DRGDGSVHADAEHEEPHVDRERERPEECLGAGGHVRGAKVHTADPNDAGRRRAEATKNAPSRWRFRPPGPPTVRLRFPPPGSDSSYRRSVLDARATLRRVATGCKGPAKGKSAICNSSSFPHFHSRFTEVGTSCGAACGHGEIAASQRCRMWRNRGTLDTLAYHLRDDFSATLTSGGQGRRPRGNEKESFAAPGGYLSRSV